MERYEPSWMTRRVTYRRSDGKANFRLHLGMFRMSDQGAQKLARYEDIGTPAYLEQLANSAKQDQTGIS